ncbi:MAG TPA: hypothetical protein GXX40_05735 [Firmicutes bacterium]|nr:hypothetical protein [Bacillota bacterium]
MVAILTTEQRRERAERHVAFIDEQIRFLEQNLSPEARVEREFQRWRQGLFRRYATAEDSVLEQRLEELKAVIRPETWLIRHRMSRAQARDEAEWRAVCEVVIIEYLLGLYPWRG